jgi:hypothetical protein
MVVVAEEVLLGGSRDMAMEASVGAKAGAGLLVALAVRALSRRSAACCCRSRRCNLLSEKKYSTPGMLGVAARRLWQEMVMVPKRRESCCCVFAATTALLGLRCGIGGRSWMSLRCCWWAAEAAVKLPAVVVAVVDGAGQLRMGGVDAAEHVGDGR